MAGRDGGGAVRILGIDPGGSNLGFGVVESLDGQVSALDFGTVEAPAAGDASQRLRFLYGELGKTIRRWKPDGVAIENFVGRNLRSALAVGQGRGVALLAAAEAGLPVAEYSPAQIKLAVTGYGRGSKEQVQRMVCLHLGLAEAPMSEHAADALATALCHAFRASYPSLSSLEGERP